MKDMKPNRKPADIVFHGGGSSGETESVEGPSQAFPEVNVHTTHQPSALKEGGYTCNCGEIASTTLLDEQYPDIADQVRRGEKQATVRCEHGKEFQVG